MDINQNTQDNTQAVSLFARISKIGLIVALVMFLFPFATVSCMSETVSVLGVEAMVGGSTRDALSDSSDDAPPNVFVILAFLTTAAALVFTFIKKRSFIPSILCVAAFIFLLLFKATFISYYSFQEFEAYIVLKSGWGRSLAMFSLVVSALTSFIIINWSAITTPSAGSPVAPPVGAPPMASGVPGAGVPPQQVSPQASVIPAAPVEVAPAEVAAPIQTYAAPAVQAVEPTPSVVESVETANAAETADNSDNPSNSDSTNI